MGRPPRPVAAGATYHVTARGNNGENLFSDDYDRYAYLALVARAARLMQLKLFAYSLMTNHVHLVLQTKDPNISAAIHRLHGPYSHAYNRRYGRHGHLFESRFRSKVIEEDSHLLEATRYTHLNPVRAGLVQNPEDYPWTSYKAYLLPVEQTEQTLIDVWPILELISADPLVSRPGYERYVRAGMATSSVPGTDEIAN